MSNKYENKEINKNRLVKKERNKLGHVETAESRAICC